MGIDPISIGIMVATTALSAVAAKVGADQKQAQYNAQARLAQQQAENTRTEATLKIEDIKRRADKIAGRQAALAGAAGVDVQGSIVDILADTREAAQRDVWNTNWSADVKADNLEASAQNLYSMGQQEQTNAMIGVGLKTVSLLGGQAMSSMNGFTSVSPSAASDKWLSVLDRSNLTQTGPSTWERL